MKINKIKKTISVFASYKPLLCVPLMPTKTISLHEKIMDNMHKNHIRSQPFLVVVHREKIFSTNQIQDIFINRFSGKISYRLFLPNQYKQELSENTAFLHLCSTYTIIYRIFQNLRNTLYTHRNNTIYTEVNRNNK